MCYDSWCCTGDGGGVSEVCAMIVGALLMVEVVVVKFVL